MDNGTAAFHVMENEQRHAASHYGVLQVMSAEFLTHVVKRLDTPDDVAENLGRARIRRRCKMREGPYDMTAIVGHALQTGSVFACGESLNTMNTRNS